MKTNETTKEQPLLKLIRFCGEELYPINEATWSIYYDEELDMNNLCLHVEAGKGIVLNEDTKDLYGEPDWELNYIAKDLTKESLQPGFRAEIPDGYEEDLDGCITNFYYCEHEGTDNNTIEILAIEGDRLFIRMTGETLDVNYYDGSKPANKLLAETWFEYNEQTMRTMS